MAIRVFGFYNGLDEKARGYKYLQQYGHLLDDLGVFQVAIKENGELSQLPSRLLVQEGHKFGLKVLLVVSNLTEQGRFSTELLSRLFRDPVFADRVWQNLREVLRAYHFDGINFDFERAAPQDRELFAQFIGNWTQRFKRDNFIVSMDVPAKTAPDLTDEWKGGVDYRALGQIVDYLILMTYEEHWSGSAPGSVASLPWITQVLQYAEKRIPKHKIMMGLPLYGYDWVEGGKGKAVTYKRALQLSRLHGSELKWDAAQHSTYFTYVDQGQRHTVYFEDLRSIKEKLLLAQKQAIRGIAIWEMNLSYPEFWQFLRDNI